MYPILSPLFISSLHNDSLNAPEINLEKIHFTYAFFNFGKYMNY